MLRYYLLAVPQMALQAGLTWGANTLLHIGSDQTFLRTLVYVAIMVALYFASFVIQQRWVFAARKKESN
jgi:putative flippase GtrA